MTFTVAFILCLMQFARLNIGAAIDEARISGDALVPIASQHVSNTSGVLGGSVVNQDYEHVKQFPIEKPSAKEIWAAVQRILAGRIRTRTDRKYPSSDNTTSSNQQTTVTPTKEKGDPHGPQDAHREGNFRVWIAPGRASLLACVAVIISCFACHLYASKRRKRNQAEPHHTSTESLFGSSSSEMSQDGGDMALDFEEYMSGPPDYEQVVKMPVPLYVQLARRANMTMGGGSDVQPDGPSAAEAGEVGAASLASTSDHAHMDCHHEESRTMDQLPSYEEAVASLKDNNVPSHSQASYN